MSFELSITTGTEDVARLLDGGLAARLGTERAERWRAARDVYQPVAVVAHGADGEPLAALLTRARPATAATKIADHWTASGAAGAALDAALGAALEFAAARGHAVLKWELAEGEQLPAEGVARGFTPLRAPHGAVGTEGVQGFGRWLVELPHGEVGYYAQTTMFTCGAVSALMAAGAVGEVGFTGDAAEDALLEVDFWRKASNYPACEPIGLAVTVQEHVADGRAVEVALDHEGPVLLEGYSGFDRSFREVLQADSLRRAEATGILVRRDRVGVDEIVRRVAGGEKALLLIDEAPMHAETGPHWIVAHASDGDDVVVVEDPWVERAAGETWVDVHDLPVRTDSLEQLVRWGDEGYRGVVFVAG